MEKDKNTEEKKSCEYNQLSLDFSNNPNYNNLNCNVEFDNTRVILLSEYKKITDKEKIDFSNLVIQHTKSF